jgi:hypothetical protein
LGILPALLLGGTFHLLKFEHLCAIWLCLMLASLIVGCFALLVLLSGALLVSMVLAGFVIGCKEWL